MTPQEELKRIMDYVGISVYHAAGWQGQGINVLNPERRNGGHGADTFPTLQTWCPKANHFAAELITNMVGDNLVYAKVNKEDGTQQDFAEYVKENKIDIISSSLLHTTSCKEWIDYCENMERETGVVIFSLAGNDGESEPDTLSHKFPASCSIIVGSMDWCNGNPKKASTSSIGPELDFMMFHGIQSGTSFATPALAGLAACIMSRFGKMNRQEITAHLEFIAEDFGAPGDDTSYGKGVPILPKPTKIVLHVGSDIMNVNGVDQKIDQPPTIVRATGRTLVPVRAPFEAAGFIVGWDEKSQAITIER